MVGQFSTPITPLGGSFLHADSHTSALTSRLLSSGNGEEILRASVGQIVFFRDRETEFPS